MAEAEEATQEKPKQHRLPLKGGGAKDKDGKQKTPNIEHVAELEEAGEDLRDIRRKRMDLTEKEVAAADKMCELQKKHRIPVYRIGNDEFILARGKDKIKIRRVKDEEEDE